MSFVKAVPRNLAELEEDFKKLFENKGHMKKIEVNLTTGHLEVTLDWMANAKGHPDFYLPIKKGKFQVAQELVKKILDEMDNNQRPHGRPTPGALRHDRPNGSVMHTGRPRGAADRPSAASTLKFRVAALARVRGTRVLANAATRKFSCSRTRQSAGNPRSGERGYPKI